MGSNFYYYSNFFLFVLSKISLKKFYSFKLDLNLDDINPYLLKICSEYTLDASLINKLLQVNS